MEHIDELSSIGIADELMVKLSGRYYTHETLSRLAISNFLNKLDNFPMLNDTVNIADPFGGDGRLIFWFIEEWKRLQLPFVKWNIHIWDINEIGLLEAENRLNSIKESDIQYSIVPTDSFLYAQEFINYFDFVITNPPWELLKPDSRELKGLSTVEKEKYVGILKDYDNRLKLIYPDSQPSKKFAGWGTNLSRVGLDLTYAITKEKGNALIVLPASFFADGQSNCLRTKIFEHTQITNISFYPAEAKLFGKADVDSSTLVFTKQKRVDSSFYINKYDKNLKLNFTDQFKFKHICNEENDYNIPLNGGLKGISILTRIKEKFAKWGAIEKQQTDGLWAGREIDETRINEFLSENGNGYKFIKGRMIDRYQIKEQPSKNYNKQSLKPPKSIGYNRIVWRDVSRSSQKRRIIATIIPPNIIVGNSLGVCYYSDEDSDALKILLGIMNSLCFEFQLRNHLATGHVSLSAIRKVCIPNRSQFSNFLDLLNLVDETLNGDSKREYTIEAFVAKFVYQLTLDEFNTVIDSFEKLSEEEKNEMLLQYENLEMNRDSNKIKIGAVKIPNHLTSNLSELDMLIVHSVPPGGNWKNIPLDVPSNRIKQIRESYAAGKGSRSTYYGRLLPNKPSYTINTYLNRPGNGCHIHYEQNRVLSQREAARLQTFPDNFVFMGSQGSVNTQIGNAVPPLFSFQLAQQINKAIKCTGIYIDLFAGAGGLGLGFKWAGWTPIVANDIDKRFLETYSKNVHDKTIVGSITDKNIFNEIIEIALDAKNKNPEVPIWVLGGPPCQGFSTAGKKRTMEDERNHLFRDYVKFLKILKPDGFVFENVSGLLSMEEGQIFENVKNEFKKLIPKIQGAVINTENYAVPQRRKRVFLIGQRDSKAVEVELPQILTSLTDKGDLFHSFSPCVSVEDALSDLPELKPGQNGSSLEYKYKPKTQYQSLMRGDLTPEEFLSTFK
jgi:Alw26I/Eco31I/Esp3I family type II restriction m6 adenine DNA methyltransferase